MKADEMFEEKNEYKEEIKMDKKYYIVRGDRSGVFAGEIEERNGKEVKMRNVRRLWYWDGACSISELAVNGTARPDNCKFTITVDEIQLIDVIEIIPCTQKAENSIKGVKEWKY